MNKKGMIGVGMLFALFMGVIIVMAMLPAIADRTSEMTNKIETRETVDLTTARNIGGLGNHINITVSNYTLGKAPSGWNVNNCPLTTVSYGNATANWTENTDYVMYGSSGIFQPRNTSTTITALDNTTYVNYLYCGDGYQPTSASRSMASIILIVTALAVLVFAAWYFISGSKEWFGG